MVANDDYYSNFSQFILTKSHQEQTIVPYSYNAWKTDSTTIEKESLQVLKYTLKTHGFPVSGNKRILISRIHQYYLQIKCATCIQRIFRGFIVRECEKARGPAAKIRHICHNNTDFHTMELLTEFPRELFFSYRDFSGFVYGFNIQSLLLMYKRNKSFVNPYNREDIPFSSTLLIFSLYKKLCILYPEYFAEHTGICIEWDYKTPTETTSSLSSDIIENNNAINETDYRFHFAELLFERISFLLHARFELHLFLQLTKNQFDRFYHYYHVWWTRPNNEMSDELKTLICDANDPFEHINEMRNASEERCQSICMELIERMIYSGIDEHHCKLGAEMVVTMLTIVSNPIRLTFPELFEKLS